MISLMGVIISHTVVSNESILTNLECRNYKTLMSTFHNKSNKSSENEDCGCGKYEYPIGYIPPEKLKNPIDVSLSNSLPPSWDWRNAEYNSIKGDWTTPIRDQGKCGSCYIFAPIAVMETLYNFKENNPNFDIDLSEQSLLSCGTIFFPTIFKGCKGGSYHAGILFLMSIGTVKENDFVYEAIDSKGCNGTEYADDPLGLYCEHLPIPCSGRYGNFGIETFSDLRITTNKNIKTAIYEYGPLVAGIEVYESLIYYNEGIYQSEPDEDPIGGHMVAIVGYNDSENCWICKNSWGENWGEPNPYDNNSQGGWIRIKYGECEIDGDNPQFPVTGIKDIKNESRKNVFKNPIIIRFFVKHPQLLPLLRNIFDI